MTVRQIGFLIITAWTMIIGVLAGCAYILWPHRDWWLVWLAFAFFVLLMLAFTWIALDALTCLGPYWWKRRD